MSKIKASVIKELDFSQEEELHSVLNRLKRNSLKFHLWKIGDNIQPKASFCLAHNNRCVFLKFFIEEQEIRANITETNGPVWEDSCVEFFVLFDESGYYNFEFNCIGTVLAAFGKNRNERTFLSDELLKKIETSTRLTKNENGFYWEMAIMFPLEIFIKQSLQSLSGVSCKANFYKCGDGLPQPHYLSWNNIESDIPDFHLPQYFGEIIFE